jgi:hypothetical protein
LVGLIWWGLETRLGCKASNGGLLLMPYLLLACGEDAGM